MRTMVNPQSMSSLAVYISEELKSRTPPKELLKELGTLYIKLLGNLTATNENRTFLLGLEKEFPNGSDLISEIIGRYC